MITKIYEIPVYYKAPCAPGSACNPDDKMIIKDEGLKTLSIHIPGLKPIYVVKTDIKEIV